MGQACRFSHIRRAGSAVFGILKGAAARGSIKVRGIAVSSHRQLPPKTIWAACVAVEHACAAHGSQPMRAVESVD